MTFIKICGITNSTDALNAERLGADILGFIFAPGKRRVSPAKAAGIIKRLSPFTLKAGVFVNERPAVISGIAKKAGLDIVQFHGDESAAEIKNVEVPIKLKAVRVRNAADIKNAVKKYSRFVDGFLYDAYDPGKRGGTGKKFDWKYLMVIKKTGQPYFIAGGIDYTNAGELLTRVMPYGIDVSSGVEKYPGKKDLNKMKKLFAISYLAAAGNALGKAKGKVK